MSGPVPLELQAKIADWRLRAADGTLTLDEMKEGVKYLRAGRVSAANASLASRKKKSVDVPSADSMLSDLESL